MGKTLVVTNRLTCVIAIMMIMISTVIIILITGIL